MKKTITILFLFVSAITFGQAKKDSIPPVKHDTVTVYVYDVHDTLKADLYYKASFHRIKYEPGFILRHYSLMSTDRNTPLNMSQMALDRKYRPFKKEITDAKQRK